MILQGQEICPHLSYGYRSPIRWCSNGSIVFLQDLKQMHEMVWLTTQYMQNMPDSTVILIKT